jgi:hypothetical protein
MKPEYQDLSKSILGLFQSNYPRLIKGVRQPETDQDQTAILLYDPGGIKDQIVQEFTAETGDDRTAERWTKIVERPMLFDILRHFKRHDFGCHRN